MKSPIGRKATLLWVNLAMDQRSVGKFLIIKPGRCEAAKKIMKKKKKIMKILIIKCKRNHVKEIRKETNN